VIQHNSEYLKLLKERSKKGRGSSRPESNGLVASRAAKQVLLFPFKLLEIAPPLLLLATIFPIPKQK